MHDVKNVRALLFGKYRSNPYSVNQMRSGGLHETGGSCVTRSVEANGAVSQRSKTVVMWMKRPLLSCF
jgi:hypothetical protein